MPSPKVIIRPARRSDREGLLALIRAYYRFDHLVFRPAAVRRGLALILQRPTLGRAWVASIGGPLCGYALLTYNFDLEFGGMEGILTDLFVIEDHRGSQVGAQLISAVVAHCRQQRIAALELQVSQENPRAKRFYERHGFAKLSREVMWRPIRGRSGTSTPLRAKAHPLAEQKAIRGRSAPAKGWE